MLKLDHGMTAKAAGLLLAGGLVVAGSLAVPALAQETKPTTQTTEIRKVVHHGGPGRTGDAEAMMKSCPGQVVEVSADGASGPDKKEAAKIKLCLKAGSKAETATRLEQVIADMDKNDMDASVKAELKAKLTAKIAELRAGN